MNRKKNKGTNHRLDDFLDRGKPADDFEKEALEGFSEFDRNEVVDAQSELDARFSRSIGTGHEKPENRRYWVAAAALLLVSGFTGYFLLQNTKTDSDLALQQETQKVAPQTPEEKKETPPPAPSPETPVIQEKKNTGGPGRSLQSETKTSEKEQSVVAADEDMTDHAGRSVAPLMEPQLAAAEAAPVDNTAAKVSSESPPPSENADVMTGAASNEARQSKAAKKEMKKVQSRSDVNTAPEANYSMGVTMNNCYYEKGDKELHADLTKILSPIGLLKRFDARLYINQHGKVDSLNIVEPYKLSTEEQASLKTELKGFAGFVFVNMQGQNVPAEYMLSFKP